MISGWTNVNASDVGSTDAASHKYRPEDFARLAGAAGFRVEQVWTDERRMFSVQYLSV